MKHLLLIEDNGDLAYGLKNNLEIEGYTVEVAGDGPGGLAAARRGGHDLVVLDLMLPGLSGFEVLRQLRDDGSEVPVLLLTARGEEADKVRGLKLGADDYVTKPFSVLELLARVEALLRRVPSDEQGVAPEDRWDGYGDVEFNRATRSVRRGGVPVELAPKELDLLLELFDQRGAVVSRTDLMSRVWGYPAAVLSRTVDTHVGELRRKLEENPSEPRHILTARGVGYRLKR
ncbi:MAG: DNA-binding response regulator [Gemmatimonadota bacterium]|nr:MAG: DNA-binding response regulator [Gemmatimonadota bacterium]